MFSVVEFKSDKTISVIQNNWMTDSAHTYFPPSKSYLKSIKKNCEPNKVKWPLFEMKTLAEFESLENAQIYAKQVSDFENTADEAEFRDKKAEKRKHPVNYNDNFDLNAKVKNIKMTSAIKAIANQKSALNDVSSVEEFLEEYQNDDVPTVTETQEIYNSYVIDKPYQDEILACSKADVKQIIKEIVSMEARLYSYIDKKFIEMKKSNSTEKTFKKLLNIHEIEKLKNDLEEDHNFKIILIRKLKSLPVITRHHSECNAKISTFIDFMFDESFIPMIRWSDTPGSKTDGRVCLINYKFVLDLFQNAIAEEIDGVLKLPKSNDIKKSIQNYFKQKNQKNAKKH